MASDGRIPRNEGDPLRQQMRAFKQQRHGRHRAASVGQRSRVKGKTGVTLVIVVIVLRLGLLLQAGAAAPLGMLDTMRLPGKLREQQRQGDRNDPGQLVQR